jgi:hypothetical protein
MYNYDKKIINDKVFNIVNEKFEKLNDFDRKIIIKYLILIIYELAKYYYDDNFVKQMILNNCNDIMSLFVLLFPYYDLLKTNEIMDLDEILKNSNKKAKEKFESTYYIDHEYMTYIKKEEYFLNSFNLIKQTLYKCNSKLMPNWINIYPYNLDNYKESKEFIDFNYQYNNSLLNSTTDCKIGFDTVYGVIKQFLYDDIKQIKWMIYDMWDNNTIVPIIIWLCEFLNIRKEILIEENIPCIIENKNCMKENKNYNNILTNWKNLSTQILKIKPILLFYYRFKKPDLNDKFLEKRIEKKFNILKSKETIDDDWEDINLNLDNENDEHTILLKLFEKIEFKDIYGYIFECMQKFKYTWYGFMCMENNSNNESIIISKEKYNNNFLKNNQYMSLKIFYNYFKYLVNYQKTEKKKIIKNNVEEEIDIKVFSPYSNSSDWNEMVEKNKKNIIEKFSKLNVDKNFSIRKNLNNLYPIKNNEDNKTYNTRITLLQTNIKNNFFKNDLKENEKTIPIIIFETLVINGIFTYFVYNPLITNNEILPNKNTETEKRKNHIKTNLLKTIDRTKSINAYNFINNKKYNQETFNILFSRDWYNNFGANWICQIQQLHHFIHNRVILVTGATGAGKSTIFPMLMLYAHKIIKYKNDTVIICTTPRIQPTISNAETITKQLGLKKIQENKINYIQYETAKEKKFKDGFSHPTLLFTTDGTLVNILKTRYILKELIDDKKNLESISEKNFCDMILIDESHENNVNMNIILTLMKFTTYINNQIILGIISATMDLDEKIYRKYYEIIDDNLKYPLNVYNKIKMKNDEFYDRNLLDRRMHMSAPFETTNYKIFDMPYNPLKIDPLQIIEDEILKNPLKGDILIFKNGVSDINKIVKYLNKTIPSYALAIPFLKILNENMRKNIMNIHKPSIRQNMNFNKNIDLTNIPIYVHDMSDEETITTDFLNELRKTNLINYPEIYVDTVYTQFIIVSTNIAEASLTLSTLSFVIDNGEHKKNIFDYENFISNDVILPIAKPNAKQRRGRTGRSGIGYYYTTYDYNKLQEQIQYPITNQDISEDIINLLTLSNEKTITKDIYPNITLQTKAEFLKKQYIYLDENENKIFNIEWKYNKNIENTVIYPYSDGLYDSEQLIDEEGKFFIINTSEELIERDDNLKIIKKNNNYINKIIKIFEFFSKYKLFQINLNNKNIYKFDDFGKKIMKFKKLFIVDEEDKKGSLDIADIICLIHCYSFSLKNNNLTELIHNMIIKIINANNNIINIKIPNNFVKDNILCDFIGKSKTIVKEAYTFLNLKNFDKKNFNEKDEEHKILNLLEKNKIHDIDYIIQNITNNYIENILKIKNTEEILYYKSILIKYNNIKIKMESIIKEFDVFLIDPNNSKNEKFETKIKDLNKYFIFCYLIVNYYPVNLIKKINNSPLFVNYYNSKPENICMIKHKYFKKNVLETNLNLNYTQNFIFYLNRKEEEQQVYNIMYIPNIIIDYINKQNKRKPTKILIDRTIYEKIKKINPEFVPYISEIVNYRAHY